MVVGMDSYHDSLNKGKSVGAMVASLNNQCTRYFSKTELHPSKDELMRNLNVLFVGGFASFSVIITRGLWIILIVSMTVLFARIYKILDNYRKYGNFA